MRSKSCFPLLLLAGFFVSPGDVFSATLTFGRSQTLEGWHERVFATTWQDLEPDVKQYVSTDVNGDLRGFSHPTATVWLQSPTFVLGAGPITIASVYLMAGGGAAPASDAGISASKSASGWAGIALRDAAGNFVLSYSAPTVWAPVTFTTEQLAPFTGQTLTLDIINMNHSSGDFLYVNRPITVTGSLASVPEPAALTFLGLGVLTTFRRRRIFV